MACQYRRIRVISEIGLDIVQPAECFEKGTETAATVHVEGGGLTVSQEGDRLLSGLVGGIRRFRWTVMGKVHAENDDMARLAKKLQQLVTKPFQHGLRYIRLEKNRDDLGIGKIEFYQGDQDTQRMFSAEGIGIFGQAQACFHSGDQRAIRPQRPEGGLPGERRKADGLCALIIMVGPDQEDFFRRGTDLQALKKINHEAVSQKMVGDDPSPEDPRMRPYWGSGLAVYDFEILLRIIAPERVVPAPGG